MFHITSAAVIGIEATAITVETDISFGLSAFQIVGLPDTSVKEARDRIRAAIRNSRFAFPRTRVTVNLAPADIKKQGPLYDLPIALSILVAEGELSRETLCRSVIVGELALDGSVRPVAGVLATALMARRQGIRYVFVPEANASEAAAVPGLTVFPVPSLRACADHLTGTTRLTPARHAGKRRRTESTGPDLKDIRGQEQAKRGLEIAAAGGHNILLKGPPGTGKTLLARAVPGLLPVLTHEESLEVTSIVSVAGLLPSGQGLVATRPFRSPHHSSSAPALVGGGSWPRPGEVSMAHRGVLFLDELPEFSRHVLEHLRQPLEDGEVCVSRAAGSVRFPARFQLVAAMNPCPCGYATDPKRGCTCTPKALQSYARRISGPLLDRFDLVLEVPNVEAQKLIGGTPGEPSADVRKRVAEARTRAHRRFHKKPFHTNAEIPAGEMDAWCALDTEGKRLLEGAAVVHHLSARTISRVRKVARTIADLADAKEIAPAHVAEALQFRLEET